MTHYYSLSAYAGNYRTRTDRKANPERPTAFARGIHGTRKQAETHAAALAKHYGQEGPDANVMFFALPCDVAERRYSLSV